MDIKIPRLVRLYDKKIKSYLSMIHISAISLIIESAFKMDFFLNEHDVLSFIEQYIKFVSRRIYFFLVRLNCVAGGICICSILTVH